MKKICCLLIFGMLLFVSCQEEEREIIDPNIDDTIPKDSQLAKLMKNVVTHDGSFDDIVDSGHCFSINLPYTIIRNGNNVTIQNANQYQSLTMTDVLEIQFPITITLFDHTEVVIQNINGLKGYADDCMPIDDDIECIDFVYPMQLSVFDVSTNRFSTVDVGHDSQMFIFMSDLDDNTKVSINYPIGLVTHNGQNISAQHNSGLLEIILDTASACEENDN